MTKKQGEKTKGKKAASKPRAKPKKKEASVLRDVAEIGLYIFLGYIIAVSANMGLAYALGTNYPVVAIVSTSMEHDNVDEYHSWLTAQNITEDEWESWSFSRGMMRGDIVAVQGVPIEQINIGDVIVYKLLGKEPIIHRVVDIRGGKLYTKGDNNKRMDQEGNTIATPIGDAELQGRALIHIPWLGYVKVAAMYVTGAL